MENDLLSLFKLILERNKLVKKRNSARSKINYHKKSLVNLTRHTDSLLSDTDHSSKSLKLMDLLVKNYKEEHGKLKEFTAENSKFRREMRTKYKTIQDSDASNCITSIRVKIGGDTPYTRFSIEDMYKKVLDAEIDSLLLETQVV